MVHFLQTSECPPGTDKAKQRYFRLQSVPFVLIDNVLYGKDFNGVLLWCINNDHISDVLFEFHYGPSWGHYSPRTTTFEIMRAGYYWLSLFKDAHVYDRKCVKCALFAGKEKLSPLPLQPVKVDQPFIKRGIDFIGVINPPSSAGHKWIITATNYFTR